MSRLACTFVRFQAAFLLRQVQTCKKESQLQKSTCQQGYCRALRLCAEAHTSLNSPRHSKTSALEVHINLLT